MRNNPYEECPPDTVQIQVTFQVRLDEATNIWEVWCPQWKCTLHDKSLTRALARIAADIEEHNDTCNGIVTPTNNWKAWCKEQGINPLLRKDQEPPKPPKLRNNT